jgi:hypothetical protein
LLGTILFTVLLGCFFWRLFRSAQAT